MTGQFLLLAAIVGLGRVDAFTFSFDGQSAVGIALIVLALVLGSAASLSLGRNLTPYPKPVTAGTMIEHGPYRLVRHPIYTAVIIGMVGIAIRGGSWVAVGFALGLIPFFLAKSSFEERHLAERYPGYAAYQQRVTRRLIPGIV